MRVWSARRGKQRARGRLLAAAVGYGSRGWPTCPGAHPVAGARACSCDRVGCPAPGAHPLSPSWQAWATTDTEVLRRRWARYPDANVVLPTGHAFDVFDVPANAGVVALGRVERNGLPSGPVASYGGERYLFFVATRGTPDDEEEWWASALDVSGTYTGELRSAHTDAWPETVPDTPHLRWHCRDSYVIAPPSVLPGGAQVSWVLPPRDSEDPRDTALPDPLLLLETLSDACDELDQG